MRDEIISILAKNWPKKFADDADAAIMFANRMSQFTFESVKAALIEWKINSRFAPTIPEISKKLHRAGNIGAKIDPDWKRLYKTIIAQDLARANHKWCGDPEECLILRYHRYYFCVQRKQVNERFTRNPERAEPVIDALRVRIVSECQRDIIESLSGPAENADANEHRAAQLAPWCVELNPARFDEVLSEIKSGDVAQEVPL